MLEELLDTQTLETSDGFTITPPAPLRLSNNAAGKVRQMIDEEGNPSLKLRIYVTGGGCSGFQYGFAFDETVNEDDLCIDQPGVTLLIDAVSLQYLSGALVDFEDGLEGSRFLIHNPNATSTCGCGSSFAL